MANISDIIADYIMENIEGEDSLCLSRNGLANFFNCSPSQINYVISTRFNLERGFVVESRRGGGGYLIIMRLGGDSADYITKLLTDEIGQSISYHRAANILERLRSDGTLTDRENAMILAMMSDKVLFFSEDVKDKLRASMLKSVLTQLVKQRNAN